MSIIVSLKDAAAQLGNLIHRLNPGEEVVIKDRSSAVPFWRLEVAAPGVELGFE